MPEYSTSLPTGTTIGKIWKCDKNAFTKKPPYWVVGMYIPDADPKYRSIVWFNIELRQGPMPRRYKAPDWSNYKQFEHEQRQAREARQGALPRRPTR